MLHHKKRARDLESTREVLPGDQPQPERSPEFVGDIAEDRE
jgi:hypothetical protein